MLVGFTALFVAIHNKYLKRTVKIPAYSEIFTPIQWIIVPIFGYLAIAGSNLQEMIILVFFTYFADDAHDLLEGIHDLEGDRKQGIQTYASSFGETNAARISFIMFFLSGIFGIFLYWKSILSEFFLVLFILAWLYILYHSLKLVNTKKEDMKVLGKNVGQIGYKFLLITFDFIFIDILFQKLFSVL
jgi:4-hydroxybenzoate polyprenyltransferase